MAVNPRDPDSAGVWDNPDARGSDPRTGVEVALTSVSPSRPTVDGVVTLVSAAWVVLSPMQNDDSWYLLMARGAGPTGYIGNQIYMFNATENPFVGSQYLMALWGQLGNGLGAAVKRREDMHKMAESNRAFAHYRW
ncbi:MAG: hypothetical protein DI592_20360 [Stenotrophomonas maltophilia]|nr:MAG: hypothetical protein DI592_20360 [Stenotrophomonas maltophilia]